MKPLRVALVQLAVEDGRPAANLARVRTLIAEAAPADLWLLPELWTTGYTQSQWPAQAREATPDAADALAALARDTGAWIGGSMISVAGAGLANRFWLFPPHDGAPVTYDKAHLFAPMAEPVHLTAGTGRVAASVHGWPAALSICFDLRFPEMYRLDAVDGAALFLVVAAWPAERVAAMRLLARARAVENQAYLALCNRAGTAADGTVFGGGSLVVAPDGTTLADGREGEGVLTAVLEPDRVDATRAALPVLTARVPGVDTPHPGHGMEPAPQPFGRNTT